jgi:hypothetical protein
MTQVKTIRIDDVEYVRADSITTDAPAETLDGKPFVIIRSYGAGVFAGYLRNKEDTLGGRVVVLDRCIRLHQWNGCSLSQVALEGPVGTQVDNRFSMAVDGHEIAQAIEVIPCTEKARSSIQGVKTWKK